MKGPALPAEACSPRVPCWGVHGQGWARWEASGGLLLAEAEPSAWETLLRRAPQGVRGAAARPPCQAPAWQTRSLLPPLRRPLAGAKAGLWGRCRQCSQGPPNGWVNWLMGIPLLQCNEGERSDYLTEGHVDLWEMALLGCQE